jgi:hypothetical protein
VFLFFVVVYKLSELGLQGAHEFICFLYFGECFFSIGFREYLCEGFNLVDLMLFGGFVLALFPHVVFYFVPQKDSVVLH